MLISVSELFKAPDSVKDLTLDLDLSKESFSPLCVHFSKPISVKGKIRNAGGVIILEAEALGEYETLCDRCGAELKKPIRFEIQEKFVRAKEQETQECADAVFMEGQEIDLLKTVSEFAFSAIPSKHLCKEDCKGLCPKCGLNLNEGECHCIDDEWDPRFEALRGLFD